MGKVKVVPTSLMAVLLLCCLQSVAGTCGGLQGDVIFLLDASGSVGDSDFQVMLQFVVDLVDDFDIGSDNVRVGVVKFESDVYTEMYLNSYYNKTALQNAISAINYTGGYTYTGSAIAHMTSTMFTTANGNRSNVPDVGIVITDGLSTSPSDTVSQAAVARNRGITMFAIGVGTGVTELNSIATDPDSDHVFTVTSFSGLANIESIFQTRVCNAAVLQPAPTTTQAPTTTTTPTPTPTSTTAANTDDTAVLVGAGVVSLVVVVWVITVFVAFNGGYQPAVGRVAPLSSGSGTGGYPRNEPESSAATRPKMNSLSGPGSLSIYEAW